MNLENGLDSAYAPNITQIQVAVNQGYIWWGFYLPKLPNTDPLNGWTVDQVDALKTYNIIPLPICVPAPPHPADPVQTANEYIALAKQYGLNPKVSILYNGEHISATGPVWLPIPGPAPTAIGDQSAIQYATGTLGGLGVDFNKSTPDFPVVTGIVVDLESNVSYTSAWYQEFQATVVGALTATPIQHPKKELIYPMMYRQSSSGGVVMIDGAYKFEVTDPADFTAFQNAGIPYANVSDAQWAQITAATN